MSNDNLHYILFKKNKIKYLKKKVIKEIYKSYFLKIKKHLQKGKTLEVGSGFAETKRYIENCTTSDQFIAENIDKKENIYYLRFESNTFDNIIMIDVFHHLKFPESALNELVRVLKPKGKIIMIEPAMGIIPRIIFSVFHHEPNGFDFKIKQFKETTDNFTENEFFAAQSLPWRFFVLKEFNLSKKINLKKVFLWSDFAFLFSGGLSYPSFYPLFFLNYINKMDFFLTILSKKLFSARMMVMLEKN